MEAQESEKNFLICDRCFATVPADSGFCPECGAPVGEETTPQASDAAVYAELSRANLLRMRGEYKLAEEQCLNILKRLPNNASANTLLGDIAAEQGDLPQAQQWYELSLDLAPESIAVKAKLQAIKERQTTHEAAETAKSLGIPTQRNKTLTYVLSMVGLVIVIAVVSFLFGQRQVKANTGDLNTTTTHPVQVGNQKSPDDKTTPDAQNGTGGETPLQQKLTNATQDGNRVLLAMQDPRDKKLTIVYLAPETEDLRALGARLARSAMDMDRESLSCTIRAMRGGVLVFTADVLRVRLNEVSAQEWETRHPDPTAWINYVLTNEWRSAPVQGGDGSTSGTGTAGTSGSSSAESGDTGSGSSNPTGASSESPTPQSQDSGKGSPTSDKPTSSTGGG